MSANNLFLRLELRYKSRYPRRLKLPKVIVEIFGLRCRSICHHYGRLWVPELWILGCPGTKVVSIKNSARMETAGMEKMGNGESGNHLSTSPASNIHQLEFLQINILIVIILVEVLRSSSSLELLLPIQPFASAPCLPQPSASTLDFFFCHLCYSYPDSREIAVQYVIDIERNAMAPCLARLCRGCWSN